MIQNYEEELLGTSREALGFAFEYQKARGRHAEALNKLTGLLYRADLTDDKAAFENKIIKLLKTQYVEEAQKLIEQFNNAYAEYKSWGAILDAYKAHTSALQSVIKFHLQGEWKH